MINLRRLNNQRGKSMDNVNSHGSAEGLKVRASGLSARTPTKMQIYHFVPVLRYIVVIKDRQADDVESIFRVNSLSSFSLGIAQMVALGFYFLNQASPAGDGEVPGNSTLENA